MLLAEVRAITGVALTLATAPVAIIVDSVRATHLDWLPIGPLTKHMRYLNMFLSFGTFFKKLDFVAVAVLAADRPGLTGLPVHVYSLARG